ncbi:MHYT domain-containing protein [Nocardia sp. NPDC003482]
MLELDHFNHGWVTPALSYLMSVIGSILGLRCAFHARAGERPGGWLIAAAVALGGAGIWVMHFTAMLGFAIKGVTVHYDMPITLASAAIAIVVVWVGLSIVVRGSREIIALPLGGAITGLGVASMHYLGMYAMRCAADIHYDLGLVTLSLVIAVVAATAALWFMLHLDGYPATLGAALIMGLAVCGMHYTGMASMHAEHGRHDAMPGGSDPMQLLTPLIVTVTLVTMMLIVLVGLAEIDSAERAAERRRPVADPALAASGRQWPRQEVGAHRPRQRAEPRR